jgi:hypothetical protein
MQTRNRGLMARAGWLVPAAALSMWGCPNQELAPLEPCTLSGVSLDAAGAGVDKVDMLFMIDNSGSMAQEQARLGGQLADLVGVLTSGNKNYPNAARNADDTFTPAKSLHVGVVTSNLGSPPGVSALASQLCGPDNGKSGGGGGILQYTGTVAAMDQVDANTMQKVKDRIPACAQVNQNPPYLAFGRNAGEVSTSDATALADGIFKFGCIATVGVNGCGIEQQLEAAWKALAPAEVTDFYPPDTTGKGTTVNNGFLRSDSVLAVVMVSDEDDCSVTAKGTQMFERNGDPYVGVRCQILKDANKDQIVGADKAVQPISRYTQGFLSLRKAFPERLVFAAIVGLPEAGFDYSKVNPAEVLAHPQMQVQLDPNSNGKDLMGVCGSDSSGGKAYPGRRFVELAADLTGKGPGVVLYPICSPDYKPALNLVIEKIASQLQGACLPRPLAVNPATKLVTCDVIEILAKKPDGTDEGSCAVAGRERAPGNGTRPVNGQNRTACLVKQLVAGAGGTDPGGSGWYYDNASAELAKAGCAGGQRVVFTAQGELQSGAIARVECFQPQPRIAENTRGFAAINTSCAGEASNRCTELQLPNEQLVCEPISQSCQIRCNGAANCPEGWYCAGSPEKFCQNPTCSITGT